ncbi:sirohydrochlorin cobaltochelatase [Klebsiella sp. BIGb0407]|uniref:sirohydrochlorin cobaltochelatase n=1 Tax=Klebsiella sp. BIGb0407 TaxID=2940603 RepID=UPI00216728DE|nr:sirohydrochlorin cobaltochelatase [Klebsiella sp. BIGb0407]MCS3433979.1 sirohydrochlorin cobaltochelatase [Klebsiella sp. BIGb0407]
MKKALLVISFGTSYPGTREKNIESCEKQLAAAFPDRDFFRAFTSSMIIRKLKQRDNLHIHNPEEILRHLHEQGYEDVAIQSLHVINGDEYEKIISQVEKYRPLFRSLRVGKPLLSSFEDYAQLIDALHLQLPSLEEDERVVFMGHGATHHAFSAYACLDHMMIHIGFPGRVGAVESYPEISLVIKGLKEENIRKVHLMPLMLVAGDHAINDMASDEEESWKTQLEQAGIAATPWLQGLGENNMIRQMFVEHLTQVMDSRE